MPEGWIFGHKGSAIFVEEEKASEIFLLGYLNSALATYFMKKIVNTTATADIGYIEKLPYRRPSKKTEVAVVKRVERIVEALKADPDADIASLRAEIDEKIFDLFEIRDVTRGGAALLRVDRPGRERRSGSGGERVDAHVAALGYADASQQRLQLFRAVGAWKQLQRT